MSSAGSALEWLVKIGVTPEYHAIDRLVEESGNSSNHVTLIPAFSGLFCPHWRPDARAVLLGLSFSADRGNICCAALEAIAMQVNDLLDATSSQISKLSVDGGIVKSLKFRQILATITGLNVELREMVEVTALGAALLAGLASGIYSDLDDIVRHVKEDMIVVEPKAGQEDYIAEVKRRWKAGIQRSLNLAE